MTGTEFVEIFEDPDEPGVQWTRRGTSRRIPDPPPPEPLTLKLNLVASVAQIESYQASQLTPIWLPPLQDH